MLVPDQVMKCVAFIGFRMATGEHRLAGTGCFLRKSGQDDRAVCYFVTARHVIDGIRGLGISEVLIRMNRKAGDSVWVITRLEDWLSHPADKSVDVAVIEAGIPAEFDHLMLSERMRITEESMIGNAVGLGDEVFIVGLFKHHQGGRRNIPIVRTGNVASMGEEKVVARHFGPIDAHLIEARSIGGLSGSPVFLNLGVVRYIDGQVKHAQQGPIFYMFGLIHGHYDVKSTEIDGNKDPSAGLTNDSVNTGIAIVVPMHKIEEVLHFHFGE